MYRKIQCRIWHDRKFLTWGVLKKMTFFYLLTGRHSHPIPGVIIGTKGEIAQALMGANAIGDATGDAIEDAIGGLIADDVLDTSRMAPLMYLKNALRHNKPTSPGQVRMWAKCIDDIPECELKDRIISDIYEVLNGMSDGMRDAMSDAIGDATVDKQRIKNKYSIKKKTAVKKRKTSDRAQRKKDETVVAKALAEIVLPYLGEKLGKTFRITKTDVERFRSLIHEGYTQKQIKTVIDWACNTWGREYTITPSALFNPKKFEDRLRSATSSAVPEPFQLKELKPLEVKGD